MVSAWVSHRCLWLVGSSEAAFPLSLCTGMANSQHRGKGFVLSVDHVL